MPVMSHECHQKIDYLSTACLRAHQMEDQSSKLLTLYDSNLIESPHKGPVVWKPFPSQNRIM